ncbi:MAG: DUF4159 domain-containing protein [Phycisphaeraceae bacterium]|nr:DUF4159 domain-containing protein [Phycisphaeraceae bacterium]
MSKIMSTGIGLRGALAACLVLAALLPWVATATSERASERTPATTRASSSADADHEEGLVRVARLVYSTRRGDICFASGFLGVVERATDIAIDRKFHDLQLDSPDISEFPFAIMTGSGSFSLNEQQERSFRRHLETGGFILASAACSDQQWARSFEQMLRKVFPEGELQPINPGHELLNILHRVDRIELRRTTETPAIYGMTIKGRLALVYTPMGLNDSSNAGDGCCCCGGNEIRNADLINANILAWALTR